MSSIGQLRRKVWGVLAGGLKPSVQARSALTARLRLFGLLVVVAVVYGALYVLVEEAVTRVEIQIVPRTVSVEIPVEVTVDRIVYRVVYVPVPTVSASPGSVSEKSLLESLLGSLGPGREGGETASSGAAGDGP